jgi:carboxyl-terminal processing protease
MFKSIQKSCAVVCVGLFAGCVSLSASSAREPLVLKVSRIGAVLEAIEQNYVEPVAKSTLMNACMAAAGETVTANVDVLQEQFYQFLQKLDKETFSAENSVINCINAMVRSADPNAEYLYGERFEDLKGISAERGAIGIEIGNHPSGVQVVSTIEDSPAARARLQEGDVVTSIAQSSIQGKKLNEVTRLLRGEIGSVVELVVQRDGEPAPLTFKFVREQLRWQSVRSRLLDGNIVYVRVSNFPSETLASFAQQMIDLRRRSSDQLRGVVLDLRNCQGGLFTTTAGLAAVFLPPGSRVVELRGRAVPESSRFINAVSASYTRPYERDPLKDLPEEMKSIPVVVLTNGKTGSGAEMVAAALQDHKRATVVGSETFKRAVIDTLFRIDSTSALRITTARAYRPSGQPIHGVGITPDLVLAADNKTFGSADDVVLLRAAALLNK